MPLPRAHFTQQLLAFAVVGLILRLLYIALTPPLYEVGDEAFYHQSANLLADGHGYVYPLFPDRPTALHPPLYPFLLGGLSVIGIDTPQGHRLLGVLTGTILIVLAGLLARRVAGERAGILTAAIAAVYPTLIRADASLLAETLYAPLVVGILLLAFRLRDRATPRNALLLGGLVGVAMLARPEALLLVPLLVLPIAWRAQPGRLALGGLAVAATAVVLVPWLARNWIAFDTAPPRISSNTEAVIAGANCPRTYAPGGDLGGWRIECFTLDYSLNEPERYAAVRGEAVEFAFDNVDRWPAVVTARLMRTWGLRGPEYDGFDGTSPFLRGAGHAMFFVLAAFAVYGIVLLRRRPAVLILLVPLAVTTTATALGWGAPRFRHSSEVPIIVLAAVGALAVADRLGVDERLRRLRLRPATR